MLLEVPLDDSMAKAEDEELKGTKPIGKAKKGSQKRQQVADFLDQHTTAKIVVVIDTHCLEETGGFIYEGTTPESYAACNMSQVSISWF
jgi:hypothetical protein